MMDRDFELNSKYSIYSLTVTPNGSIIHLITGTDVATSLSEINIIKENVLWSKQKC